MKKIIVSVAILMISLIPMTTVARPKAIVLLRHAEEPKEDVPYLSKIGQARAKKLPDFFKTHSALKNLGKPVALFAAGAKKSDSSIRSIQTAYYLSLEFKIPVNDSFNRDDFNELTKEIKKNEIYDDKVVVIIWQHLILSDIAKELGVKQVPEYPSGRFDRIWLITYDDKNGKNKSVLQDLPQHLMPGDSTK